MFTYKTCTAVPVRGGRGMYGNGLVEVEGRVVWGARGGMYVLDEASSKWEEVADGVRLIATLAVCGGELVSVGGRKDGCSKEVELWRGGRWTSMSNMLVGCWYPCVLSISGGGMVVMGGYGAVELREGVSGVGGMLRDVQVFDGKTWHFGPPLPERCRSMSAVVHGDHVFVVGGKGMKRAVWSANITDLVSH